MSSKLYVLAAVGCYVSYLAITRLMAYIDAVRFSRTHGCKPAPLWPQPDRIIGWQFYKEQLGHRENKRLLQEGMARFKIGHTFEVTELGNTRVSTEDPENIKAILATNFKDFGLGPRIEAMGAMFGSGIFTTDGHQWEHSRALVRPNFARSQVADLDTFETHIKHLVQKLPRDGSTIDLQPYFFQLTFDSATEFLFGESVEVLLSPEGSAQKNFATAFDYGQAEIFTRSRLGPFLFTYRNPLFDQACKTVHNFVDAFVYKALEERRVRDESEKHGFRINEGRYVFLNELTKSTKDPKQLRDELLNILLAGRDTTAGLLSNTFHALARRPDVWRTLKAEVDDLGGKAPDYDTLRSMKYLKYVLNESLRLWPLVPINARFANKNTTLPRGGGPDGTSPVFVPKGRLVGYSSYAMHRRTNFYGPDAGEFKPERWETLRTGWSYLPFNGGPRICVGQQFALTEAGYTIVRMVQEFEKVEARDPLPWREGLNLTLCCGDGLKVALTPRSNTNHKPSS